MAKEVISFDIETVGQVAPFSQIQQDELDKKLGRYLEKHPDADPEEAKWLITGTSGYLGEIVCIGLYKIQQNGEDGSIALVGDEKEMLEKFWNILRGFRGTFVSFGGLDFDVPFLLQRSMKYQVPVSNDNFLRTYRFGKWPHLDVKEVISDYDRWSAPTLRLTCDLLGVPSPKEGSIEAKDVAQAYADGRIDEIAEYCKRDVISTYKCFEKLQGYYYKK